MTITVEDGTNVPNANSYVSVADLDTYALERGIDLPTTEEEKEILLIKAMDYIEVYDKQFWGERAYTTQSLSHPRIRYGMIVGIPNELRKLQMVLAVAAMTMDLLPVSSAASSFAKRKTVGPITVEYDRSMGVSVPRIPMAERLLSYLTDDGINGQLRVIRA